jgi:hypothetical protein
MHSVYCYTGSLAGGPRPRWLPHGFDRGQNRHGGQGRFWPAASGEDRRRYGASPGKQPTPQDLARRGEPAGANAAPNWSPEQASTARPSGGGHGHTARGKLRAMN